MEENKFWIAVWSLVTTGVLGLAFTIGACDAYSSYTMRQMVERGADPIKARCAIYGSGERNAAICTLAAQGKQ